MAFSYMQEWHMEIFYAILAIVSVLSTSNCATVDVYIFSPVM